MSYLPMGSEFIANEIRAQLFTLCGPLGGQYHLVWANLLPHGGDCPWFLLFIDKLRGKFRFTRQMSSLFEGCFRGLILQVGVYHLE